MSGLRPPDDESVRIESGVWMAEVSTSGGALGQVRHAGIELLDGFPPMASSTMARGQILAPWTNRLRDGRYEFMGESHQLEISDPATMTALHGLASRARWDVADRRDDAITLELRLDGTDGYPWTLLLQVTYVVAPTGLIVTHEASNLAPTKAPYAIGAHPYVVAGDGRVDDWRVELDASRVMLVDPERMLPLGIVDVDRVGLDFRAPRTVGTSRLNHAFTGLGRDPRGRAGVSVSGESGRVLVWGGHGCRWIQLYTSDDDPIRPRRSIAVEPMSAPADAFNSGRDLVVLAPGGQPGSTHVMEWGIGVEPTA